MSTRSIIRLFLVFMIGVNAGLNIGLFIMHRYKASCEPIMSADQKTQWLECSKQDVTESNKFPKGL